MMMTLCENRLTRADAVLIRSAESENESRDQRGGRGTVCTAGVSTCDVRSAVTGDPPTLLFFSRPAIPFLL